jgi:hypothetical protein
MSKIGDILVTLFMLGISMPFFKGYVDSVMNTTGYATALTTDKFVSVFVIAALPWLIPMGFAIFKIIRLVKKDEPTIRNF